MADTSNMLYDVILNLEHETWKALQKDGRSLIPYLSKDAIFLFPLGLKVTSTTTPNLKDVLTSEAFVPWSSYEMTDVEVTPLGENAAVISYKVKAMRPSINAPDDGKPFLALVSTTWRKDPEVGWLMVFHQQTPYQDIDM